MENLKTLTNTLKRHFKIFQNEVLLKMETFLPRKIAQGNITSFVVFKKLTSVNR